MDGFWVVVGGVLTIAATAGVQWLRGNQEASLDKDKRADDRRLARDAFQRENLLTLQEAFHDWMRAQAQAYLTDAKDWKEQGKVRSHPADVSEREFEAGVRLLYVTERVRSDSLRERLNAIQSRAASRPGILPNSAEETESHWQAMVNEGLECQLAIGRELRQYL